MFISSTLSFQYLHMERHSSNAMYISEIPVCYFSSTEPKEKLIHWIDNLNSQTTVRDVILSIMPACDPNEYSLYISTDKKKHLLNMKSRIYKIVSKIHQQKSSKRLLFEIRKKKRVRFADEILVQHFSQDQETAHEKLSLEQRLETIKENFQKHICRQQENHLKSSIKRRSSLKILNRNISTTSEKSLPTKKTILETLV